MPPSRGVGVLWTSRSRMPGYSLYFRLSRQTPHESAKVMAAVKMMVKTYCFTGPPAGVRLSGSGSSRSPEHLAQARAVDRALPQHADDGLAPPTRLVASMIVEAMPVAEGPPSRYTATLSPSISCASSAAIAGGLAGEVRARDGERAGLLEQFEGDPVRRHAHGDGALRLAEVPGQRRLRRQDDREPAGPELLDESLDGLGHLGDECAQRGESGDEHGRRRLTAAPFASSSRATARGVERVRGDAVDGVGGEDDELAPADGLARLTHAGEKLRLIAAVEDGGHVAPSLDCRPDGALPAATHVARRQGRRRGRRAVAHRESGCVAAARQPSAARISRIASPCHSPCSITISAARMREAQTDAAQHAHDVQAVLAAVERGGRIEEAAPPGRAGSRHPEHKADWRRPPRRCRRARGSACSRSMNASVALSAPTCAKFSLGPHEGVDRVLRGEDAGVRHLGRQREGDRAAAGAEVDCDGRRATPRPRARRSPAARPPRSPASARRRPGRRAARGGGTARRR